MFFFCIEGGSLDAEEVCFSKSFLISADGSHANHPNYPEAMDGDHGVEFHKGLVVKTSNNQNYATNMVSATLFM